jgi:hypothetical protein
LKASDRKKNRKGKARTVSNPHPRPNSNPTLEKRMVKRTESHNECIREPFDRLITVLRVSRLNFFFKKEKKTLSKFQDDVSKFICEEKCVAALQEEESFTPPDLTS